jgi:hypothetical protein
MPTPPTPRFQPLDQVPLIASVIDGMLEAAQEQDQTLQPVRHRPHVLDDVTVQRVIRVFTEQRDGLWIFEEQLRRWRALSLTADQAREIERLAGQLERLRAVDEGILALAEELKAGTIERVLETDDAQTGLQALLDHPLSHDDGG